MILMLCVSSIVAMSLGEYVEGGAILCKCCFLALVSPGFVIRGSCLAGTVFLNAIIATYTGTAATSAASPGPAAEVDLMCLGCPQSTKPATRSKRSAG